MVADDKQKQAFKEASIFAELGQAKDQYTLGLMYANGVGVAQNFRQALYWYTQAAQNGFAAAQYILGNKYATGAGVKQDLKKALSWHFKAAEQGHPKALFKLGKLYATPHPDLASSCFQEAADKGLADAQMELAQEFASGKGAIQDFKQALLWYKKAAEQGLAAAQYALGGMIEQGQGCEPDMRKALFWYRKAAAQKFAAAQITLSKIDAAGGARNPRRSRSKAVLAERRLSAPLWAEAAELGDTDARYQLGLMYDSGLGVKSDPRQAEFWFRKAAEEGDARAQLRVAKFCEHRHTPDAVDWYRKAADQGNEEAQFALGKMYSTGQDVEKDLLQGFFWYIKAAQNGDPKALFVLGRLCDGGLEQMSTPCYLKAAEQGFAPAQSQLASIYARTDGADNSELALFWWTKAAEQNDVEAQYNLSLMYSQRHIQDSELAFFWMCKAAEQGLAVAQSRLGLMYVTAQGVELDYIEACKWFILASDQGDAAARNNREHSESLLTAEQISEAQHRAKAWAEARQARKKGQNTGY